MNNNSCNFSLGEIGQVLTMIDSNKMAFQNPSNRFQTSVSRSLNTVFQISSTKDCEVRYSIDITCNLSLTGGTSGTVILEMATNSDFTENVQILNQFTNSNTGALTIGLSLSQTNTACLTGYIPAGNYVRIRTSNISGSPVFTYQTGQEVLL